MFLIALFGLLMMLISVHMIKAPDGFAKAIIAFSQLKYFHSFEIINRLLFAVIFIHYAEETNAELINSLFGFLMGFTSIFLVVIGEVKHRKFALWSATKFNSMFRYLGVCSLFFGGFIIYSVIYNI